MKRQSSDTSSASGAVSMRGASPDALMGFEPLSPSTPGSASLHPSRWRVRPLHFHAGPNPSPEYGGAGWGSVEPPSLELGPSALATASPTSPGGGGGSSGRPVQLYKNAVQAVCKFLRPKELGQAMAVSHTWSSAVQSMRCMNFRVKLRRGQSLEKVLISPLARHISHLVMPSVNGVSNESLLAIRNTCPHLRFLHCRLQVARAPYVFPPTLTRLVLRVDFEHEEPAPTSREQPIIDAIALASQLTRLDLVLPKYDPTLQLSPLTRLEHLQSFSLVWSEDADHNQLSDEHVDAIRSMRQLQELSLFRGCALPASILARLVRPPHALQLKTLYVDLTVLTDEHTSALERLPSLEALEPRGLQCSSLGFLAALPNLQALDASILTNAVGAPAGQGGNVNVPPMDVERYVDGLVEAASAPHLQRLALSHPSLTHAHLARILAHYPWLECLRLGPSPLLESLSCLSLTASGGRSARLRQLEFGRCPRVRSSELIHLDGLPSLEVLYLDEGGARR